MRQVVAEYRSIRAVILRLYAEKGDVSEESRPKLLPITTMNAALDTAIADAVDQYAIDQGKAREMFIGMLGHDLRDPLNTIAFSARLLSNRGQHPEAERRKIVRRIESSAARIAALPTIFAPFSPPVRDRRHANGAQAADRRRGHLGLGLYIVHEIATAHGGKVIAGSHSGQTMFRLVLPRIAPKNDSLTAPSKEHDPAEASRT